MLILDFTAGPLSDITHVDAQVAHTLALIWVIPLPLTGRPSHAKIMAAWQPSSKRGIDTEVNVFPSHSKAKGYVESDRPEDSSRVCVMSQVRCNAC